MSVPDHRLDQGDCPDSGAPGWYGKLPAIGDFAFRRLPQHFIAAWDRWLADGLNASRAVLGDRWLECYLNAPVWRFGLMRGLIDEQAWFGIMMPSVDRVGRYFPLTVVAPIAQPGSLEDARSLEQWLRRVESAALTVLSDKSSLDGFERLLVGLTPTAAAVASLADEKAVTGPWPIRADDFADALTGAALAAFWRNLSGGSLWWSADRPAIYRHPRLPAAADFHLLLAQASD